MQEEEVLVKFLKETGGRYGFPRIDNVSWEHQNSLEKIDIPTMDARHRYVFK